MAILSNWDTTNYMDESGPPEDEYYGPIYCPLCGAHHNEWEEGDAAPGDLKRSLLRRAKESPEFLQTLKDILEEASVKEVMEIIPKNFPNINWK